ncbi:phenylacetate--CoA ligase family protein [Exiguobacterium qingdaonense]|uniref:phenylacetate--CoA ligase family protein n=1 Tax=Exiguobacterium qingdaonense TaxID=2751251 RepID=UPI001BE54DAB|nr:phenylacetate--CoA ligase family protein [Exiguobacterium qingdaonense]
MAGIALRDLYMKSPILLQQWMTTLYGLKLWQERYGEVYERELVVLANRSNEREVIEADQLSRLNAFLQFCMDHNMYYQELFKEHDIILPFESVEDLKRIPILEKETLRKNPNIHSDIKTDILGRTGGTTGMSLEVHFTKEDYQKRMAHVDFFKAQYGFERGMKRASFTGRVICDPNQKKPIFWRYNRPLRQMLISLYHVNPLTIPHYIDALNQFKPVVLDGAPSAMIEIAKYTKENRIQLEFQLLAIFPTAETITPQGRALLEEAFHAPVYDQYASSEGAPILTECIHGNMHLHHETGVIESYGDHDEILVTSFTTHGTPLIRYRIGDRMKIGEGTCPCGQEGTFVTSIEGRESNYVMTPSGRKVYEGDLTTIVRSLPNSVIQTQYRQRDLYHIEMKYVPDLERFKPEHEDTLRHELHLLFGQDVTITLTPVQHIPRGPNGKIVVIDKTTSFRSS